METSTAACYSLRVHLGRWNRYFLTAAVAAFLLDSEVRWARSAPGSVGPQVAALVEKRCGVRVHSMAKIRVLFIAP